MLNKEYYITIDCPPGNIRPDNILTNVLVNTKLNSNNFTVKCKSFGEWTFVLNYDCNSNNFIESLQHIKISLTNCYKNGQIRYAEWYEEE
jgi:hypothetical protein